MCLKKNLIFKVSNDTVDSDVDSDVNSESTDSFIDDEEDDSSDLKSEETENSDGSEEIEVVIDESEFAIHLAFVINENRTSTPIGLFVSEVGNT